MIPNYPNIPVDILNYINSHPAYSLIQNAKVDWDLWHAGYSGKIAHTQISLKSFGVVVLTMFLLLNNLLKIF